MQRDVIAPIVIAALVALVPFTGQSDYFIHILVQILLWGFIYTAWSLMGRFGLVSLGHGAFMGIGAYVTVLLWNFFQLTPWIGMPIAVVAAVGLAAIVGWPCVRLRIVGHYFALVTLALTAVVALSIVGLRDITGGSLGLTPTRHGTGTSLYAFQFASKTVFLYVALVLWLIGLVVWRLVDQGMGRFALQAISSDEDASASVGINVGVEKIRIILLSAGLTALGGAVFGQYQMYINPETVSGIGVSLQIVFAVVAGGMFVQLGPTVGAAFTLILAETLRILIGNEYHAADTTIYGLMLVLFIIFMPKGILGALIAGLERARAKTA
jgi:branched-chain amino acid transport system permease protein